MRQKMKHFIAIQWKIAVNRLQEKRNLIDGRLDSAIFDIPGTDVKYYVSIYPNGNREERRGQTWIFLHLIFAEQKDIEAKFSISIKSANYSHENNYVYKQSIGWGGKSVCTVDELFDPKNRFIVGDEMIITIEGYLIVEKNIPVKLRKLASGNGNILGLNLWNQGFKDFTIVAEGKEITVHKCVLSSCSPVFNAMFQPHTLEAQENRVTIPVFPFHIVETAVKLCYDSRLVDDDIPINDQMWLLHFSDKYDIQSIKDDFENLMISEITELTVCLLANCSIIANAPKLRNKCSEFLRDCLKSTTAVSYIDLLDKDFALDLLKYSFFKMSL